MKNFNCKTEPSDCKNEQDMPTNQPIEFTLQVDITQPIQTTKEIPLTQPVLTCIEDAKDKERINEENKILKWKYSAHVLNSFFFYISLIYAIILYVWLYCRIMTLN